MDILALIGIEPVGGTRTELTRSKITNYVQAALRANIAPIRYNRIFQRTERSLNWFMRN
ncbi:hypothetical protein C8J35_12313 [Rhizobium sp. PP-F2F-G38]|nr:hypothetical protein C8J35_12313 [Rhizobium sp. PP-F2F-G38]